MIRAKTALTWLLAAWLSYSQQPSLYVVNRGRPVLDAHNCYPYDGRWTDRLDRALRTGFPVAIEQDLAWDADPLTGHGRVVVSHEAKTTGSEPTLQEYFFEHVRPLIEKELREANRSQWPLVILHFDFKSNEPVLLEAVWNLLGEYEDWITTAPQALPSAAPAQLDLKPILV